MALSVWPNRLVAIILVSLSSAWIYLAIQLPFPSFARVAKMGPGHYPAGVAAVMGFLSILFFLQTFRHKDPSESETQNDADDTAESKDNRSLLVGTALFVGYVILVPFVGFLVSSIVFVFCFIRLIGRYSAILTAILAALIPILMWVLFARLLTVPLPKGPWGF